MIYKISAREAQELYPDEYEEALADLRSRAGRIDISSLSLVWAFKVSTRGIAITGKEFTEANETPHPSRSSQEQLTDAYIRTSVSLLVFDEDSTDDDSTDDGPDDLWGDSSVLKKMPQVVYENLLKHLSEEKDE